MTPLSTSQSSLTVNSPLQTAAARRTAELAATRKLSDQLKTLLLAAKGEQVLSYDIASVEPHHYTDLVIIATAASTLHLRALGAKVQAALKAAAVKPFSGWRRSTQEERWLIMDCGNIVIHIFMKEDRSYYDLDEKFKAEITKLSTEPSQQQP